MSRWLTIVLLLAAAAPASAQTFEFLPRFDFHLTAERLASDDPRFDWDANFGGELDLFAYDAWNATFEANYQVVMGVELRRFDPNQGNYILAGRLARRVGAVAIGGVFYHQSRHMSDRDKRVPIDWNMLGARLNGTVERGAARFDGRADLRGTIQKSFVDYRWELDARLDGRLGVRPRVAVITGTAVRLLGVDGSRNRGTQVGFRAEGGVRVEGSAAAMELFVAAERRVDPYPLEFGTANWVIAGFRLVSN